MLVEVYPKLVIDLTVPNSFDPETDWNQEWTLTIMRGLKNRIAGIVQQYPSVTYVRTHIHFDGGVVDE